MAVAYRAASAVSTSFSSVSPVITAPAGLADGDLIIIAIGSSGNLVTAVTMSNGFTLVHNGDTAGGDGHAIAMYKVASGEGASWTFTNLYTVDFPPEEGIAAALAYTGVDGAAPLSGTATENYPASTTTPSCTAMTPAHDNCMLISCFLGDTGGSQSGTQGTGWTERADYIRASQGYSFVQEKLQTTATSEAGAFTAASAGNFGCIQLALKPAITLLADLTGTALAAITEADIVTGGKTIIATLTGDTWISN